MLGTQRRPPAVTIHTSSGTSGAGFVCSSNLLTRSTTHGPVTTGVKSALKDGISETLSKAGEADGARLSRRTAYPELATGSCATLAPSVDIATSDAYPFFTHLPSGRPAIVAAAERTVVSRHLESRKRRSLTATQVVGNIAPADCLPPAYTAARNHQGPPASISTTPIGQSKAAVSGTGQLAASTLAKGVTSQHLQCRSQLEQSAESSGRQVKLPLSVEVAKGGENPVMFAVNHCAPTGITAASAVAHEDRCTVLIPTSAEIDDRILTELHGSSLHRGIAQGGTATAAVGFAGTAAIQACNKMLSSDELLGNLRDTATAKRRLKLQRRPRQQQQPQQQQPQQQLQHQQRQQRQQLEEPPGQQRRQLHQQQQHEHQQQQHHEYHGGSEGTASAFRVEWAYPRVPAVAGGTRTSAPAVTTAVPRTKAAAALLLGVSGSRSGSATRMGAGRKQAPPTASKDGGRKKKPRVVSPRQPTLSVSQLCCVFVVVGTTVGKICAVCKGHQGDTHTYPMLP